jgi:hypothetical protein
MNTNPEHLYTYKALLTVQRGKTTSLFKVILEMIT